MNCANSFCFHVYLMLHACAVRFDVTGNLEKFCELNKAKDIHAFRLWACWLGKKKNTDSPVDSQKKKNWQIQQCINSKLTGPLFHPMPSMHWCHLSTSSWESYHACYFCFASPRLTDHWSASGSVKVSPTSCHSALLLLEGPTFSPAHYGRPSHKSDHHWHMWGMACRQQRGTSPHGWIVFSCSFCT